MHAGGSAGLLGLWLAVLSLTMTGLVSGLTQQYCSSENTASGSSEQSIYQSNGHCQSQCQDYAFAIVQGQSCWCSDYVPSSQESTGSCNEKCPGYPFEYCGSSSGGLYGYIILNKKPSGTAGADSSSTDSNSTPSSTFATSATPKPSSATPEVTTIVSSGNVLTVTTTPTVSPMQTGANSGGISKGAVAGVVVAAFAGLTIVGFGLFFCLRRRNRDQHVVDSSGTVAPSRMGSQLSRNGLLGNPFRNNSVSHTQQSSAGDITPVSPVTERRYSKPLVFDQRLNPDLMIHEDSSRVSISTLEDHRDYNRKLNITNPDPEGHA